VTWERLEVNPFAGEDEVEGGFFVPFPPCDSPGGYLLCQVS